MNWPEMVTIKVIDSTSTMPIPKLLLFVEVLAQHKNHYSIGPLVTNKEGEAILTRAQVEKAIADLMRDSPMDYSSKLSDCTGEVRITVDDEGSLAQRIDRVRTFYPEDAGRLEELAGGASNSEVEFLQITARISSRLSIEVRTTGSFGSNPQ
jgi:hypothetical protein